MTSTAPFSLSKMANNLIIFSECFLPEITKHSFGPAVTIEQKHMVFVEITFDVKI